MPVASFDRGTKRQCVHCAMKYYDLNRDPIICPGCGKPYEPPEDPVARKSAEKDSAANAADSNAKAVKADPAATATTAAVTTGTKIASFEDGETDTDGNETAGEDIPDVEDVEDIGGEVDNSFVEGDDDDDDLEFNVVKPKADE